MRQLLHAKLPDLVVCNPFSPDDTISSLLPVESRAFLMPTEPQFTKELIPQWYSSTDVKLTKYFLLEPGQNASTYASIPPFFFIAQCLIKHSDKFTSTAEQ